MINMQLGKLFDHPEMHQTEEIQRSEILEMQIAREEVMLSKKVTAFLKDQAARLCKK